jgi:hypothetical protein
MGFAGGRETANNMPAPRLTDFASSLLRLPPLPSMFSLDGELGLYVVIHGVGRMLR